MDKHGDYCKKYGQWAVISGGAQGIGAAFAERFADRGMSVILLDANSMALGGTVERLQRIYPAVKVVGRVVDLADRAALTQELDDIAAWDIGILVANAGIAEIGLWLDVPMEAKIHQIDVNCVSALMLSCVISEGMASRGRGGIIIMASGAAEMGSSYITTYAATKAFDRILAEGLYSELKPKGIDVCTVMPGSVDTPGFWDTLKDGRQPTAMMRPISASVVVDATLQGLGKKINIRPTTGTGPMAFIMSLIMKILPRQMLMSLCDKAVRQMYSPER